MPSYRDPTGRNDRLKGWAMVAAVYTLGALVWLSLPSHPHPGAMRDPPTVMVDIETPPPPPTIDTPKPKAAAAKEEGAAGKKAQPSPIVAPEPRIPTPSPLAAAPVAGNGSATTAGAADRGNGPGAGGAGNGGGGGRGGISMPRFISGGLRDSDYPRSLVKDGVSGNVSIRFTVLTSGRIANCRIARSSGSSELDQLTCRLLTDRLRFVPAHDAQGRAVPYELGNDYGWGIRRR